MKKTKKFKHILKEIGKETAALAFTIAGGVTVIFTLSGQTRKVALISLSTALIVHVIYVVVKAEHPTDDATARTDMSTGNVPGMFRD